MSRPACLVLSLFLCLIGGTAVANVRSVGTDQHLWFILDSASNDEPPFWSLAHHGTQEAPGIYQLLQRLDREPLAMAAVGHHLWIVLPSDSNRPGQFPVRVLQVAWNQNIERYVPSPRTGLGLLPPIISSNPTESPEVIGLSATQQGPAVLMRTAQGNFEARQLRRGVWAPLDLPEGLEHPWLSATRDALVLVDERAGQLVVFRLVGEGDWLPPQSLSHSDDIIDVFRAGDRLAVASETSSGEVQLGLIQPEGLAELATLGDLPRSLQGTRSPYTFFGHRGRVGVVHEVDGLKTRLIDPLTGEVQPWLVWARGRSLALGLGWVMAAFAASIAILLVLLLGPSPAPQLPEGYRPLAPLPRLLALLIDAVPGLIVASLWLDVTPRILIDAALVSLDASQWQAYGVVVGLTCVLSLIMEISTGTSLGKRLMGAHLVRPTGERVAASRLVLRSLLKGMMLLLPILAVTALRPPAFQSVADQAAGVIVVRRVPPAH